MKFKIEYRIFSLPNDEMLGIKRTFEFVYIAKTIGELADITYHVNKYLQQYFAKDNYEITSIKQVIESNE